MTAPPSLPTSLTAQLVTLLARPITPADRARATLHVLDWLGCALLGAKAAPGAAMQSYGRTLAAGGATAIGTGRLQPESAALVNGSFGNVLEMDDIHRTSILHPGPVVIPAALAHAEAHGATAGDFLDALIRGYEVVIRIGASVGLGHYKYFHNTATCGPFGAAAAVGSLLHLTPAQMVHALGTAGTVTGGFWQVRLETAMSKQFHTGHAARAGLVAADMAKHGFTGPAQILEGPLGMYAAMCPDAKPAEITADPHGPWKVYDTSFKPWAACRHSHATIDAALLLREQVKAEDVAKVTVHTYGDAKSFCDRPDPKTVVDAKFSLQHAVAVVLQDGPPVLDSFELSAIARPELAAFRPKVTVEVTDRFNSAYPQHYGTGLVARTRDGRTIEVAVRDALGDPGNPVSDDRVVAKARQLMAAAGLPAARIDSIVQKTRALADGGDISALTALLPQNHQGKD
jgi:2-methylcitrate dehydratase PrpD